MPFSYFSHDQIFPLVFAVPFLILSFYFFQKNIRISLLLLFLGTLVLGYFMANLNPYFAVWDEQFHAMVAKNLSEHWITPMLYSETPAPYNPTNWSENHIWLHKQPLFLWQIALSIKLFGANVMAVRIPSIIMHAILPLLVYRIGRISINKSTGYYAALLMACSFVPLELTAGVFHTDHNDLAFLFYLTASFWAWFEYQDSQNKYWLIIIGLLSGCAVLVKWLLGLLVFVMWFISKFISESESRWRWKSYLPILYSGLIALLIFLPWQFYIFHTFPTEAQYEFAYNSKHFFEVVEAHGGDNWYHFDEAFQFIYGEGSFIPFIVIIGLVSLLFKIDKLKHGVFLIGSVLFTYLFYTLAETKMPLFTLIVMPIVLLGYASLLDTFLERIFEKSISKPFKTLIHFVVIAIPVYISINLTKIETLHTFKNPIERKLRIGYLKNMEFIKELNKMNLGEEYVLFNAEICYRGNIPIMFHTGITSYYKLPSERTILDLQTKGRKIAVVDRGNLPEYILSNPSILILQPAIY